MAEDKESKILDFMLKNMALERNEMTKASTALAEDIDDIDASFSKWNETSTKEFATSPIAMSKLLNKVEVDNTKTLESLRRVMDNFSELLVANQHEYELNESEESLLAEEKAAQASVESIKSEFKTRRDHVTEKMKSIFTGSRKAYDDVLASMAPALDDGSAEETQVTQEDMAVNIIPMLQKKNMVLKSQLDLALLKAKSVTNQWTADRTKIDAILLNDQTEIQSLKSLLRLSESRLRFQEQASRDPSFLPGTVSKDEYDILKNQFEEYKRAQKKEIAKVNDELDLSNKENLRLNAELNLLRHQVDSKANIRKPIRSLNKNADVDYNKPDAEDESESKANSLEDDFNEKLKATERDKDVEITLCNDKISKLVTEVKIKDTKIEKLTSDLKLAQSATNISSNVSSTSDDGSQLKVDPNMLNQLQKLKREYELVQKERDSTSKAFDMLSKGMEKMMTQIDKNQIKLEKRLEIPYESINKLRVRVGILAKGLGVKAPVFNDNVATKSKLPIMEDDGPSVPIIDTKTKASGKKGAVELVPPKGMFASSSNSTTELLISQYEQKITALESQHATECNEMNASIDNLSSIIEERESEIDLLTNELAKVSPSNPIVASAASRRSSRVPTPRAHTPNAQSGSKANQLTTTNSRPGTSDTGKGPKSNGNTARFAEVKPVYNFEIDDSTVDEVGDMAIASFKKQSGINDKLIACSNGLMDIVPEFVCKLTEIMNSNASPSDMNSDLIDELSYLMEVSFHALGVSLSDFILGGGVIDKDTVRENKKTLEIELARYGGADGAGGNNNGSSLTNSGGDVVTSLNLTAIKNRRASSCSRSSSAVDNLLDSSLMAPSEMSVRSAGRASTRRSTRRVSGGTQVETSDVCTMTSARDEDQRFMLANVESMRVKELQAKLNRVNSNSSNSPLPNTFTAPSFTPNESRSDSRGGTGDRKDSVSGETNPNPSNGSQMWGSSSIPSEPNSRPYSQQQNMSFATEDEEVEAMRSEILSRGLGSAGGVNRQGLTSTIIDAKLSLAASGVGDQLSDDLGNYGSFENDFSTAEDQGLGSGVDTGKRVKIVKREIPPTHNVLSTYYDDERSRMDHPLETANIEIQYEDIVPRPRSPNFYSVQQEIATGELKYIGDIRNKNFESLQNKGFGPERLIKITLIEHHIRYQSHGDASSLDDKLKDGLSSLDRMQQRAMVVEAELLVNELALHIPLEELARFKKNTEKHILQLQTFSTWRKIRKIQHDGIFLDVLTVHRDVIDRCIAAAGGWKAAMQSVRKAKNLFADTSIWPEFFRVQILEFIRHSLFEDFKSFEKKIQGHECEIDRLKEEYESKISGYVAQVETLDAEVARLKEKKSRLKRASADIVESLQLDKEKSEVAADGESVPMDMATLIAAVIENNVENNKKIAEEVKLKEKQATEEAKSIASKALMQSFNTSDVFLDDVRGEKVLSLEEKIQHALELANKTVDSTALIPETLKHVVGDGNNSIDDKLLLLLSGSIDQFTEADVIRRLHLLLDRVVFKYFEGDVACTYILEMANDGLNSWSEGFDHDAMEIFSVCFKTFHLDPHVALASDFSMLLNKLTHFPDYLHDLLLKISNAIAHHTTTKDRPTTPGGSPDIDMSHFAIERRQREEFKEKINENFKEMNLNFQQQVATSVATALLSTVVEQVDIGIQTDNLILLDESSASNDPSSSSNNEVAAVVIAPPPVIVMEAPKDEDLNSSQKPHDSPGKGSDSGSSSDMFGQMNSNGYNPKALPPGFFLAHVSDNEVELCPGITLVSPEKWPQDCVIPPDVIYVYRKKDSPLMKGLRRLPRYVRVPRVDGFEAVNSPLTIELFEGASIIFGSKLPYFATLPPGLVVIKLKLGCRVPTGLTTVQISPILRVPPNFSVPSGLELVQMHTSIMVPGGVTLQHGIQTADNPTSYNLPFGLQFIKRTEKVDLPGYMTALEQASFQEEEISVHGQICEGCTLLKKPQGFSFGLGIEILHRPEGHGMPVGMAAVPLSEYPKGLKLSGQLELVQLTPRFDLPSGCIINKDWQIIARPPGVRLQPNTYLIKYSSNQRADTRTLPNFITPVPLPPMPKGGTFPKNVICAKFGSGVGLPIPYGFQIAPGITVLSPTLMTNTTSDKNIKLPINAILVRREPNSILPAGYERGSCSDLPSGVLLDKNMEIVLIGSTRFEVPAGVKLGFGLMLGRNTQLCPDSILNRDLKVIEWPSGMIFPPGVELVELAPRCDLPYDYEQVNVSPFNPFNMQLPQKAMMVKLPEFIKIPSTQQLAEKVEIVELNGDLKNKPAEQVSMFKKMTRNGPNTTEATYVSNMALQDGLVLLHRQNRMTLCPSELTLIHKSSLPMEIAKALEMKNGNTMQIKSGSKDKAAEIEKKVFEVASVEPTFHLPPGIEVARGVYILPCPTWLLLPSWAELVCMHDPYQFTGQTIDPGFEAWRAQPFIAHNEVGLASPRPLPPNSVIINIPNKASIFAWKSAAPGVESVEEDASIWLPEGHYLIERPRFNPIPAGFELGFSPLYPGAKAWYKLQPGMEVVHLLPSYHLPLGVSIESSLVLKQLLVMQDAERYPPPIELLPSICKLSPILQFSPGQSLSNGCTVLPFPSSFLNYENPLLNRLINAIPANPTSNRAFDNKGLLLFVSLNPTVSGFCFPPDGCYEFPDATTLVAQHFPFLRLSSTITAIVLPEKMLNNRDRLMQNANMGRLRLLSGEDSAAAAAARKPQVDSEELIIHPRVKEPTQIVEVEAELSLQLVAKKATVVTDLTTKEDLIVMLHASQLELEIMEEENTQYRLRNNEITREFNHTKNKLDRLIESQLSNDEQFRHYREEISALKGEISRLEKAQSLKVEDLQKLSKKYLEMQERMSAQIGVLQDQVATWKDASAGAIEEKRMFKHTLMDKEKTLVEKFEHILSACKGHFRQLVMDVLDQVCTLNTNLVCALSNPNLGLSEQQSGSKQQTPQTDQHRLPTIPSGINVLDDDSFKLDTRTLMDQAIVHAPKPGSKIESDNAADYVDDADDVSVLSEDSAAYLDSNKQVPAMLSVKSISAATTPAFSAKNHSNKANSSVALNSKTSVKVVPKQMSMLKPTTPGNVDLTSHSAPQPEFTGEAINPTSYLQMIKTDDRFIGLNRSVDVVLESFIYKSDIADINIACRDFKDSSFIKNTMESWFSTLFSRARDFIIQDRNKSRVLSSRNENEIKAFSKQCRSLNRNIEMLEKMLLEARSVDIRPVPETTDKLLQKVKNLENSIDIMRESTLNPIQDEFRARVETIKSYKETEESLFWELLVLKKKVLSEEALVHAQAEEAKPEMKIAPSEIKAIKHNIKAQRKLLENLLLRRQVVKKSMEDLLTVIIEDVQSYERIISKVLPSNIIESLLKWGSQRNLILDHKEDSEKDLLSRKLFKKGHGPSGHIDTSDDISISSLDKGSIASSSYRPDSNDSSSRFPNISTPNQFGDNASLSSMSNMSYSSSLKSFGGRSASKPLNLSKASSADGEDFLYAPQMFHNGSVGTLPAASVNSHLVSNSLRKGKIKSSKKK